MVVSFVEVTRFKPRNSQLKIPRGPRRNSAENIITTAITTAAAVAAAAHHRQHHNARSRNLTTPRMTSRVSSCFHEDLTHRYRRTSSHTGVGHRLQNTFVWSGIIVL